jgi:tRNA1(Val) A37 N6-methylase TrmN6
LRKTDTKVSVLIFDIADDMSHNDKRNFTLNHFSERISLYNEQQFDYQISKVNL